MCKEKKMVYQDSQPLALGTHTYLHKTNTSRLNIKTAIKKFVIFVS